MLKIMAWALLLAGALPSSALAADKDGFDLSGTTRLRLEAISGQARAGFNSDDALINLRTVLTAAYHHGPYFAVAELWDSRVYGGNAGTPITTNEVNTLEPVQAYVGMHTTLGGAKATLTAGRMMLNLGSRRIVAADDYRNTTNGYTGLRADLTTQTGISATLVYVLPQQRRPNDSVALRAKDVALDREGFDQVLWGGVLAKSHAIGAFAAEGSFFHLGERDTPGRPTRDRSLDTYGGRLYRDAASGVWDGEIEGYYQSGRVSLSTAATAASEPVSAWFIRVAGGYTVPGPMKAHWQFQYDRASGDGSRGTFRRFDTIFGFRRGDLAPSGLYNAILRSNVHSAGARLEVAPSRHWDAFLSYRALWLASATDSFSSTAVRDPSGRSGSFAGHQFDGRMRYWLRHDKLLLELDGVLLAKGRFLQTAPNATANDTTAYGSLNLLASF